MDANEQTDGSVPEPNRIPPMTVEDFEDWLANFQAKIVDYHTTFGFTQEQMAEMQKLFPKIPPPKQP